MKAARIYEYGTPDVFRVEEAPKPTPGPKEVLIEVHAAALNPVDYKLRQGGQRGAIPLKMPTILGMDVAGVVVEVGTQVKDLKPGDEVYSSPNHKIQGSYAEFVAIPASEVALKPHNLSFQEAAGVPLAGLTAWESLVVKGQIKKGDKVLIQAGSGGVGTFAIQIAKHFEAHVSTTCSGRNVELVESLGADRVVDYTKEQYDEVLEDIDIAVEALGDEHVDRNMRVLKKGGRLAALNAGLPGFTKRFGPYLGLIRTGIGILAMLIKARLSGKRAYSIIRQPKRELLQKLTDLIESGQMKVVVDRVFPLDEIAEAHRYLETGRARGKVIIAMKEV